MTQEEIKNVFREKKLSEGRMISSSKSTYCRIYPENDVIFNCNLLTKNGKIWHGDLDLTVSQHELMSISDTIKEAIYALREMDYRFETEKLSLNEALHRANLYYVITGSSIKKIQKDDHL